MVSGVVLTCFVRKAKAPDESVYDRLGPSASPIRLAFLPPS